MEHGDSGENARFIRPCSKELSVDGKHSDGKRGVNGMTEAMTWAKAIIPFEKKVDGSIKAWHTEVKGCAIKSKNGRARPMGAFCAVGTEAFAEEYLSEAEDRMHKDSRKAGIG